MQVQFEFTQEDLVDATKRFLDRRKPQAFRMWKAALYSALSVGLVVFLVLRNTLRLGIVLGLIVAGIFILFYPRMQKSGVEGRLRRIAAEMMSDPGPYMCEVQVRSEGVWVRSMNKQTIHEWRSLEAIEETSDSVDIFTHDGGGVVVRNRAFASEGQRSQFVDMVKSGLIESRS